MNAVVDKYLGPGFVYAFDRGPRTIRSPEEALRFGLNCVSLAHLVMMDLFGFQLPQDLDCYEMYVDRNYFEPVEGLEAMQTGDLVWFGRANSSSTSVDSFVPQYDGDHLVNWADFPVNHVAVYTGHRNGDFMMLHATHFEGTTALWPLARFSQHRRYQKIYGISRLRL